MFQIDMVRKLEGVQTIDSVMSILGINKSKAIQTIYQLRKSGYVKTHKRSDQTRIYNISLKNKLKGVSYYEIINPNSPIKISPPNEYKIYGRTPSIEETIVFAIKTKSLRTILASLILFRKVTDWSELYHLSKTNRIERQVGALYDLTRLILKRSKRMPKRFMKNAQPKENYPFEYTIPGLQSKDFQKIENKWKIYLPFNKTDLEEYHDFN
ncbi:MAG: hypothetical protein AABX47_08620 [Nanoarchaeota archaeon]